MRLDIFYRTEELPKEKASYDWMRISSRDSPGKKVLGFIRSLPGWKGCQLKRLSRKSDPRDPLKTFEAEFLQDDGSGQDKKKMFVVYFVCQEP